MGAIESRVGVSVLDIVTEDPEHPLGQTERAGSYLLSFAVQPPGTGLQDLRVVDRMITDTGLKRTEWGTPVETIFNDNGVRVIGLDELGDPILATVITKRAKVDDCFRPTGIEQDQLEEARAEWQEGNAARLHKAAEAIGRRYDDAQRRFIDPEAAARHHELLGQAVVQLVAVPQPRVGS